MSVCPKCGAEIEKNANFCENCGTAIPQSDEHLQKNASVMGDKNVVAGDVVAQKIDGDNVQNKIDGDVLCDENVLQGNQKNLRKDSASSPMMGDKNVVAGDVIGQKIAGDNVQNKIMGNVIYNVIHKDTKVQLCSICNRHLNDGIGHTCSNCGKTVCDEHFDEEKNLCLSCADDARQKAMSLYEQLLISISSEGKKREANVDLMLNEKRSQFGLTQADVSALEKKYNLKKKTVYVAKDGSADFESINDALTYAEDGISVIIKYGEYEENLTVDKEVSIIGEINNEGNVPTIASLYGTSIKASATLKNLAFASAGISYSGICIDGEGVNPLIEKCDIHNNRTGIRIKNKAHGLIKNCKIYENFDYNVEIEDEGSSPHFLECKIYKSKHTGVYILNGATGKIEKCSIFDNNDAGVSIRYIDTNPLIVGCEIYKNKLSGVFIWEGALGKIEGCDVYKNQGVGIFIRGNGSNSIISKNKIHHNSDGLIAGNGASVKIEDCDLYENRSTNISIHDSGTALNVKNCKIHNAAEKGVLISSYASGEIEGCDIYENQLNVAVQDSGSSVHLYGCKIHNAAECGVMALSGASGKIEDCDLYENHSTNISIHDSRSSLNVKNCKIRNAAECGAMISSGASGKIEDCDLYENHSTNISIHDSGSFLEVKNCKIHNAVEIGVAIASGASGKIEGCDIYENKLCNISVLKSESSVYLYDCKIHDGKLGVAASFIKTVKVEKCEIYSHDDLDIGVEPVACTNNIQIIDSSIQSLNKPNKSGSLVKQAKVAEKGESIAPKENLETKKVNSVANQAETSGVSKKSNQSTGIDWKTKTPKTAKEWDALSSEAKQDWFIWHEGQMQGKFAAVAAILEIIAAAFIIYENDSGTGYSVLTGILAFIVLCLTFALRKILYKALRATTMAALLGSFLCFILYFFTEEGTLRIVLYTLAYVLCLALFGYLESKGALGKKTPNFPNSKS